MRILLVAVLGCISMIACTKETHKENSDAITGKWEVRKEVGGFAGIIQYEPGQGPLYEFSVDNKFSVDRIFLPGGGQWSGTYQLKASRRPGDWLLVLSYINNQTSQTQMTTDSIRFEKKQLIFLPAASCCDIPTTFLERVLY